jgi:malonyl-CoA O-methyltransferase
MIFTFAFDRTVSPAFIENLSHTIAADGGEILFVELTCEQREIEKRVTDASRQNSGKLNSLELYRELHASGAFIDPGIPSGGLSIDVTRRKPSETAGMIAEAFGLPTIGTIDFSEPSVQAAYDNWAISYDQDHNRTRDLDGITTRKLLGNLRVASIIEIGCGTGKNTIFYSEIGEQVLALDFSESMLARARAKTRDTETNNVTFRRADITQTWPCDRASADLVTCNLVLEHVRDLGSVFSEAARCLDVAGKLFISELHPYRQYEGTRARFERGVTTTEIEAFIHHVSDFMGAAEENGLTLNRLDEWWHADDENRPPRLITFLFSKSDV